MGCNQSTDVLQPSDPDLVVQSVLRKFASQRTTIKGQLPTQLSIIEMEQLYAMSNQDLTKFLNFLQEKFSQIYITLSASTLSSMNQKKFIGEQNKTFLCSEVLWNNLIAMKFISEKEHHKYNPDTFRKLNKMQKNLIGYLKMKYPRKGHSFVSGDLLKVFKSFSMVDHPKNDLLRNANIYFGKEKRQDLMSDLKKFFNVIIDELDEHFPKFAKLLTQKVFIVKVEQGQKTLAYKIGRKLPQNVAKYSDMNSHRFQIRSPQIFRVIIKWVQQMEQLLINSQTQVDDKSFLKIIEFIDQNPQFDFINRVEQEQIYTLLKQKLNEEAKGYKEQIQLLKHEMDKFNSNLIKIIHSARLQHKYVPIKEAQVIKYAMHNVNFLSWMLAQKLMIVMETLIRIGKSFEESDYFTILDLIQFKVTDLMRAMVTGSKKQIFQVYENMKKLQEQKKVKIIKIKNRLGTALNDAMIIFTVSNTFLICELQLLISDEKENEKNEKYKNIQSLNHFLYQLQRSPYGVQSQLAVVLGYKDSKVKYESKIKYIQDQFNFTNCQTSHPESIKQLKIQKVPIICTFCTTFYRQNTNPFGIKICEACNHYICSKCLTNVLKSDEKDYLKKQLLKQLSLEMGKAIQESKKTGTEFNNAINTNFLSEMFHFNSIVKLQDIPGGVNNSLPLDKFTKFLVSKLQTEGWSLYFLLIQFEGNRLKIQHLHLNASRNIIFSFQKSRNFYKDKQLRFQTYDFIVPFNQKKVFIRDQEVKQMTYFNIFNKNFKTQSITSYIWYPVTSKISAIIGFHEKNLGPNNENSDENIKVFAYQSIEQARQKLPNTQNMRQIYDYQDTGINDKLLSYFQKVKWKQQIKQLNLSKNNITNVDIIFKNLSNLQKLYLKLNSITSINVTKKMNRLQVLNVSENQLQQLKGFSFLSTLSKLDVSSNQNLSKIQQNFNLPHLKYLNIETVALSSAEILQKAKLPKLKQLFMSYTFSENQANEQKLIQFSFPQLKMLKILGSFSHKNLKICSSKLEILNMNNISLNQLIIHGSNIKTLNLQKDQNQICLSNLFTITVEDLQIYDIINATFMTQPYSSLFPFPNLQINQAVNQIQQLLRSDHPFPTSLMQILMGLIILRFKLHPALKKNTLRILSKQEKHSLIPHQQ